MNDTLMDQYECGESADSEFLIWMSSDPDSAIAAVFPENLNKSRGDLAERIVDLLNAERSKRPPTVQGPPMITVDGAMEAMARHYFDYHQHPIGHKGNALYDALHKALTAAATNNTNDNG